MGDVVLMPVRCRAGRVGWCSTNREMNFDSARLGSGLGEVMCVYI